MKKIASLLAAAACLFGSAAAHAQFYVGGSAGIGQTDVDCSRFMRCDDSGTGVKLYAGFKVAEHVAIEAAAMSFGSIEVIEFDGYRTYITGTSIGLNLVLLGDFNEKLTGAVRLGMASNTLRSEHRDPYYFGFGADESGGKPHFGLSLGYRMVKGLTIEAGIDFTQFEMNDETVSARLFGVGAKYQF